MWKIEKGGLTDLCHEQKKKNVLCTCLIGEVVISGENVFNSACATFWGVESVEGSWGGLDCPPDLSQIKSRHFLLLPHKSTPWDPHIQAAVIQTKPQIRSASKV